jgi:hypothetical protein
MSKIIINPKNEYTLIPEFNGNKAFPESNQMKVIVRRINRLALQSQAVTTDGRFSIVDYTKSLIVRIENPFVISNGTSERALTIDDIFKFPELEDLSAEIFNFANKIQNENGEINPKNL